MGSIIEVVYEGDRKCLSTHMSSGKTVSTKALAPGMEHDGDFAPTDLVATAVGSCVISSMGILADRKGIDIKGSRVKVTKNLVKVPANRIGSIALDIFLKGRDKLDENDRKMLQNAANACTVKNSLHPEVDIRIRFHDA